MGDAQGEQAGVSQHDAEQRSRSRLGSQRSCSSWRERVCSTHGSRMIPEGWRVEWRVVDVAILGTNQGLAGTRNTVSPLIRTAGRSMPNEPQRRPVELFSTQASILDTALEAEVEDLVSDFVSVPITWSQCALQCRQRVGSRKVTCRTKAARPIRALIKEA